MVTYYNHREIEIGWKTLAMLAVAAGFLMYRALPEGDSVTDVDASCISMVFGNAFVFGVYPAILAISFGEYWRQRRMKREGKPLVTTTTDPNPPHRSLKPLWMAALVLLLFSGTHLYASFCLNATFRIWYYQKRFDLCRSDESKRYFYGRLDEAHLCRLDFLKRQTDKNIFYAKYFLTATKEYVSEQERKLNLDALRQAIKEKYDNGEFAGILPDAELKKLKEVIDDDKPKGD